MTSHSISPLAPKTFPEPPPIAGVRFATAEAGIRYRGRTDVLLMLFDEGTEAAGVLTQSKCPSAPVDWCRAKLSHGGARALLVNSGNANAFTGRRGRETVRITADAVAKAAGCSPGDVFLASTGVIGEPLDPDKYLHVLEETKRRAAPLPWIDAARAIMTTDTFPKLAFREIVLDGVAAKMVGIAKGAGMIAPDMATMLSFVATDAAIAAPVLQRVLSEAVETTFNCISVDGDTSTSDTLLLFATGKAGGAPIFDLSDPRVRAFAAALTDLLGDLARLVVRDGEGAQKFVEITVTGAVDDASARKIALSIANSPLVKTAIAGEDANWGRIVMAVGKAGEPADRDRLSIRFGPTRVACQGERDPDYDEALVSAYMRRQEIEIGVDLGLGTGRATVWTCDLTHGYIDVNGSYRS